MSAERWLWGWDHQADAGRFMHLSDGELAQSIEAETHWADTSHGDERREHEGNIRDMRTVINLRRARSYRRVTGRNELRA